MNGLITAVGVALLLACQSFADEHSVLARITVYWHREGSGEHASWNGTRLCEGHCAVDPKRIPYGSKVIFPDAACVAVDTWTGCGQSQSCALVRAAAGRAQGHRHRPVFRQQTEGARVGKSASSFHDGANSNARQQRGRQARSFKRSKIVAHEHC